MQAGDKIKYYFPEPNVSGKNYMCGEVLFISDEKVTILCEDKSIMVVSFKNYERIEKKENYRSLP